MIHSVEEALQEFLSIILDKSVVKLNMLHEDYFMIAYILLS